MPAIAALTVNDGNTTPVAHTFSPVTSNGSKAEFAERSAGTPAGNYILSHEVVRPSTAAAAHRIKIGLNVPVVATVDGSPTVVRNSSAQVILNLSNQSSEQERKDLLAFVANVLDNTSVKATVTNIEPFY